MNRIVCIALGVSLAVGAFAQSRSSTVDFAPSNVNLRISGLFLLDDSTRDAFDNPFGIGIDINTPVTLIKNSAGYLSIDWFRKSLGDTEPYLLPIVWNQRFALGEAQGRETYYFVGAGFTNINGGGSKWVTTLRGGVGVEFNDKLFAEVTGYLTSETNGNNANSVAVSIGYKF